MTLRLDCGRDMVQRDRAAMQEPETDGRSNNGGRMKSSMGIGPILAQLDRRTIDGRVEKKFAIGCFTVDLP